MVALKRWFGLRTACQWSR